MNLGLNINHDIKDLDVVRHVLCLFVVVLLNFS